MTELIQKDLTYEIRGCLYKVADELGVGFIERTYHRALCRVFKDEGIELETEKSFPVTFQGEKIDAFCADLVVDGKVIVELKAVDRLALFINLDSSLTFVLRDCALGCLSTLVKIPSKSFA